MDQEGTSSDTSTPSANDEALETQAPNEAEASQGTVDTPSEVQRLSYETLEQQLAEAQRKVEEQYEQLLRANAALENLRRRHERELENAHKYALDRFAQDLLPVVDSVELGIAAASDANVDVAKLREGKELILKLLLSAFEKYGIQAIDPQGERFNPELHQAMSTQEANDVEPNTVVAVMQKGYLLNDRLIRPAMVMVSRQGEPAVNATIDETA